MDKKFLAIVSVLILAFVGYLIVSKRDSTNTNNTNGATTSVSNHSVGAGNKKVTLVEYGDFECPACGGYYPLLKQVKEKYGDDITFQFKNFPIDSIHPSARAAHRAAEAASSQDKFFEMHDLLYENQQTWRASTNARPIFESYATQLGLDMTRFATDFSAEATNEIINADITEGKDKGVNATPTFFLNGVKLNNDDLRSVDQFSAIIDAEIAKSTAPAATVETTPAQ